MVGGEWGEVTSKAVIMKWGDVCAAEYCACLSRGGHACSTMGGGVGCKY